MPEGKQRSSEAPSSSKSVWMPSPAFMTAVKSFIAGSGAGVISKSSVAPMERTKVLAQIERLRGTNRPIFHIIKDVYKKEGFLSFWKGNGANCTRIIPNKGLMFMCNDYIIQTIKDSGSGTLTVGDRLLSGSISGAILVSATYPLDLVAARLTSGAKFNGIAHCLSDTYKVEGVRGLYRGYLPSLLGVVPYTGAQFAAFEVFKSTIMRYISTQDTGSIPIWVSLVSGACAGTTGQSISYPLDTIRRRMQVQGRIGKIEYSGPWDCAKKMWRTEGIRGFYRGIWVNAARAGPSQAVQFASYQFIKKHIGSEPTNL